MSETVGSDNNKTHPGGNGTQPQNNKTHPGGNDTANPTSLVVNTAVFPAVSNDQARRIALVQLEYARDVSRLAADAYDRLVGLLAGFDLDPPPERGRPEASLLG